MRIKEKTLVNCFEFLRRKEHFKWEQYYIVLQLSCVCVFFHYPFCSCVYFNSRCVYSNWANQYLPVMPSPIPVSYPVLHIVPKLICLGIIYEWVVGHTDHESMVFRNRFMLWYILSNGKTTSNSSLCFQMIMYNKK